MSVLCKILRMFVNTLSDNHKHSLLYRDNLMQPIQKALSRKQKTFSEFFSAFFKSTLNFEHSQQKDDLIAHVFPKLPSLKKLIK